MNYWQSRGSNVLGLGDIENGTVGPRRRAVFDKVVEYIDEFGFKSIVDVGANIGLLGLRLREDHDNHYIALDSNPHAVRVCTSNGLSADVRDATELPFRARQKSCVVLLAVIQHLPYYTAALEEATRVAKDGIILGFWKDLPDTDPDKIIETDGGAYNNKYNREALMDFMAKRGWQCATTSVVFQTTGHPEELMVFVPIGD